jgi:hypothetical protein
VIFYTDNPVLDAERYTDAQERELQKLPVCCKCKERIQDDTCYVIDDEVYCESCMRKKFERWTEDLME